MFGSLVLKYVFGNLGVFLSLILFLEFFLVKFLILCVNKICFFRFNLFSFFNVGNFIFCCYEFVEYNIYLM